MIQIIETNQSIRVMPVMDTISESPHSSEDTQSITSKKSGNEDYNWKRILDLCHQTNAIPFGVEFPSNQYNQLQPVDSGSYSLVSKGFHKQLNKDVVFKVVNVISSKMSAKLTAGEMDGKELLSEMVTEIMVTKWLSNLHNTIVDCRGHEFECHSFPRMLSVRLVQGFIPNYLVIKATNDSMVKLEKIDQNRESPGAPRLYLVVTMKYCGEPLWKVIHMNKVTPKQLLSICYQITLALTVCESVYEFEHRDLHIANVLLKATKKKNIKYVIKTEVYRVQSFGIKAYIIDTTFSRIKIGNNIHFTSLSNRLNPKLNAKGTDLQDWAYKCMTRAAMDDWKKWNPKTNIYWLRYLYKTIQMSSIVYKSKDPMVRNTLEELLKKIIKYNTLEAFVKNIDNIR